MAERQRLSAGKMPAATRAGSLVVRHTKVASVAKGKVANVGK
jgi:hypothetical protein